MDFNTFVASLGMLARFNENYAPKEMHLQSFNGMVEQITYGDEFEVDFIMLKCSGGPGLADHSGGASGHKKWTTSVKYGRDTSTTVSESLLLKIEASIPFLDIPLGVSGSFNAVSTVAET